MVFGDLTVTNADLLRGLLDTRTMLRRCEIQLIEVHEGILGLPSDGDPKMYFDKGVAPKKSSVTPSSSSSSGKKRENPVTLESSEDEEEFPDEEDDDDAEDEEEEEEKEKEDAPANVGPKGRHTWTKAQEDALVAARTHVGYNSWRKVYNHDMTKKEGTKLLRGLTNYQLKDKYREIVGRDSKKARTND